MNFPYPKKVKEFPFFILCYWVLIWGVLFLYSGFTTIAALTPDGKYIEKTECITKSTAGICNKFSAPYYVAAGAHLSHAFITQGILVGFAVIIVGAGASRMKSRHK